MSAFGAYTYPLSCPIILTFGAHCPFDHVHVWSILIHCLFIAFSDHERLERTYALSVLCLSDHVHVWSILIHCLFIVCPTTLTFGAYLSIVCSLSVRPCWRLEHTYPLTVLFLSDHVNVWSILIHCLFIVCSTMLTFGGWMNGIIVKAGCVLLRTG